MFWLLLNMLRQFQKCPLLCHAYNHTPLLKHLCTYNFDYVCNAEVQLNWLSMSTKLLS